MSALIVISTLHHYNIIMLRLLFHNTIPSVHRIFSCHLPTIFYPRLSAPRSLHHLRVTVDNAAIVPLTGQCPRCAQCAISKVRRERGRVVGRRNTSSSSLDLEAAKRQIPRRSDSRYLWDSDRRNLCILADNIIQIFICKKKRG